MLAVGKQVSESTKFTVCQDHFDMVNDIRTYREHDGRPVLYEKVVPHLKMNNDEEHISASGSSTHNVFYNHRNTQTDVPQFRSVEVQTDVPQFRSVEVQTDPIDLGTSSSKRKIVDMSSTFTSSSFETSEDSSYVPTLSEIEEVEEEEARDDSDEEESEDEFDDEQVDSDLSDYEKSKICDLTMRITLKDLNHYTGIPVESSYIIDLIAVKSGVCKRNILLILRKIRHNESLVILGDAFGISFQHACLIFATDTEKIATCLQPFIYWPEKSYIQRNLPLQFKHKYKFVQVIIDCFETSIGKPRKPLDQALSWSQYKHSNTVKHLIGCTPDGFIIFISKGFLGRISDNEIVRRSGFLNFVKKGTVVMADRGFKDLQSEISLIDGILIKPPSTTAGVIYTSDEAKLCKSIAATRIHVERVIGKIRNFAFLKPHHSLLSSKRTYLLEYAITIASAICNIQGLLTKI